MAYKSAMDRLNESLQTYRNLKDTFAESPTDVRRASSQRSLGDVYFKKAQLTYNNTDLESQYSQFRDYVDENIGGMNAETIDQMEYIEESFKEQYSKNGKFDTHLSQMDNYKNKLDLMLQGYETIGDKEELVATDYGADLEFLMPENVRDGTATREEKKQYNSDLSLQKEKARHTIKEDITKLTSQFGEMKGDMYKNYYDRIGPGGQLKNVSQALEDQSGAMGFVIASLHDDGMMDTAEMSAYTLYLQTTNKEHIDNYITREENMNFSISKGYQDDIENRSNILNMNQTAADQIEEYLDGTLPEHVKTVQYYNESLEQYIPLRLYDDDGNPTHDLSDDAMVGELKITLDELDASVERNWDIVRRKDSANQKIGGSSILAGMEEMFESDEMKRKINVHVYGQDKMYGGKTKDETITQEQEKLKTEKQKAIDVEYGEKTDKIINRINEIDSYLDANPETHTNIYKRKELIAEKSKLGDNLEPLEQMKNLKGFGFSDVSEDNLENIIGIIETNDYGKAKNNPELYKFYKEMREKLGIIERKIWSTRETERNKYKGNKPSLQGS